MAEKKYYWLKLKDNFFTQKEIKKLRKIAGGDTYTIIYLKLQLLSLKTDGVLMFEGIENNIIEELALELDEDVENVKVTWLYLEKYGIVEQINNEQFLLPQTMKLIGSETAVASRVRRYRENQKALQCNTAETNGNTDIDIEIEKEIELDIDIHSPAEKKKEKIYKPVIEYLNEKTKKNYKATTQKTKDVIDARVNEGFTLEDFKKVIDIKAAEWLNTGMEKYLRPETLFSNKFEGYLNQKANKSQPKKYNRFNDNMIKHDDIDFNEVETKLRNKYMPDSPDTSELEKRMKERWGIE